MSAFWASQSAVTDPGNDAETLAAIASLPSDIASLRDIVSQFSLHYRARGSEVRSSRRAEIHTMFVDVMLARLMSRGEPLGRKRSADERTVGCCRDSAVLLVALLRQKGIPARARIGHAAYFDDNFMIDHVVAEVWDAQENRWRLVDPDVPGHWEKFVQGKKVDWVDVRPGIDFQTSAEAWTLARAGSVDPSKYIIAQEVDIRGLPYIAGNVAHDLAAMNKQEMLLWDAWGLQLNIDKDVPDNAMPVIDEIGRLLLDRDVAPEKIAALMAREELTVPERVLRFDPNFPAQPPKMVSLGRAVAK